MFRLLHVSTERQSRLALAFEAQPHVVAEFQRIMGDTLRADFVKVQNGQERGPGEASRRERLAFAELN
jgi:hypothetical protein